jgi:uncharacterized UPF0160 family protein
LRYRVWYLLSQHRVATLLSQHRARYTADSTGKPADDPEVHLLWLHVYKKFVEAVDAIDNGINQFDTDAEPRYEQNTTLASRVGQLNPSWNETSSKEDREMRFAKAMELTGREFRECLRYAVESWLPGRSVAEAAMKRACEVHPSGVLSLEYSSWRDIAMCFLRKMARGTGELAVGA